MLEQGGAISVQVLNELANVVRRKMRMSWTDTRSFLSTLRGRAVGPRDAVTFEGRSLAEVEKAFRAGVDDYPAFCAEQGERPLRPCGPL